MKPHSLKPEFPLEPTALEILSAVTAEAASAGIECMAILELDHDRLALDMVKPIRHEDDAQSMVEIRMRHFKAGMLMRGISA